MNGSSSKYNPFGAVKAKISPLGDLAVMVQFGETIEQATYERVRQLSNYLERFPFVGMVEYVPSFLSVTVYYDPYALIGETILSDAQEIVGPYELAAKRVEEILAKLEASGDQQPRIVEIPVCYGGEFGPDLPEVAAYHNLSEQEVIDIHSSADYLVYMLGFAPGFAYLGGLPESIATPRRQTPRLSIPAGTVGIAGDQTGVYPIATPGGWQLIGRTTEALFLPSQMPPTRLRAGDIVRFRPISRAEYDSREAAPS
ncbi:5-oxoprolinase subunit PxpB [Cohnella zeiphila]|uniref:5-oxoprolinase subunit PxpB n=1 Tax=Cohnella zeiphila TaxID=2761120 RepID=A0A7X0VYF2_9BACL|nr:5-oxoprolinase subunit PxpB [Cohnella zeiphila]MBB6734422.1 5-oxoprolinase subunit PxpB [Cohnella zeiphila]